MAAAYYKGVRYQRRQLPRRLASVATAVLLWVFIGWWAVGGGRRLARLVAGSPLPWLPSLAFCAAVPVLWRHGNPIIDRALRTVPRLLYHMHVDHWKLLTLDVISRPVARFTTVALTVIMLNSALLYAPHGARLKLPRLFYAESEDPSGSFEVDASAVAELLCPLSRRALRALAVSMLAGTALTLRHPPSCHGSRSFRLVPLRRRGDSQDVCVKAQPGLDASPVLLLFSQGMAVAMPPPVEGAGDGLPVWTFEEPLAIDEYTWETPSAGPPEADPVEWRLEAKPGDSADLRWHGIHETDAPLPGDVPLERGRALPKRYFAPHGEVPPGERGLLGRYYRALQRPREDRDACALALLAQGLAVAPLVLLGLLPWLSVVGVEFSSVVGMTSVGGVAAGAALSLAKSEVLENLFAGTLLSAQGHIINGDEVDILYQVGNSQQSLSGVVQRIGCAYVSLLDQDGQLVQMPNRRVLGSIIRSRQSAAGPPDAAAASSASRGVGTTTLNYLSRRV